MSVSALTRALTLVCLFFSINAVMYNIKANLSVCVFVCFCFHFCTASFQRRRRTRTEVDPAMASTPPPGTAKTGFLQRDRATPPTVSRLQEIFRTCCLCPQSGSFLCHMSYTSRLWMTYFLHKCAALATHRVN